jgi:hypothetical protein
LNAATIFKKFATKAVNNAHKQACIYFNCKDLSPGRVRMTVKAIISDNGQDLGEWNVETIVRDSVSWQELGNDDDHEVESRVEHKIKDNTDFHSILDRGESMFCGNDFESMGSKYKNSAPRWRLHYNAALVVPVLTYHNNSSIYFGFVAIDSLNSKKEALFIDSKEDQLYQVVKSLSEVLSIWHMTYDNYINSILKEYEFVEKARTFSKDLETISGDD